MTVYHPKQHWPFSTDVNSCIINFKLYAGKSTFASGKGLSCDVVMANKDYLGHGCVIYCDNFYTSPLLFLNFGQQGFRAYLGDLGIYRPPFHPLRKMLCIEVTKWVDSVDQEW